MMKVKVKGEGEGEEGRWAGVKDEKTNGRKNEMEEKNRKRQCPTFSISLADSW